MLRIHDHKVYLGKYKKSFCIYKTGASLNCTDINLKVRHFRSLGFFLGKNNAYIKNSSFVPKEKIVHPCSV